MADFTLVITGDTHFGENYQQSEAARGRGNVLTDYGYAYTMANVAPFLQTADLVVANLETPVTDLSTSPYESIKRWLSYSNIHDTPQQLLAHNIKAVSMANNHAIDYGEAGLRQTLDVLESAGIATVGAGLSLPQASKPLNHGPVKVFAAFAVSERYETSYQAYAQAGRAGVNPLNLVALCQNIAQAKASDPDSFVIALLHWQRDYRWRSRQQYEAAQTLLAAGCDLLLGHGSHMMQEIEKVDGRWVVHGLGNFVFNSPGRYAAKNAPPYSLAARLTFSGGSAPKALQVYPLFTDNRITHYQTRFVTETEFDDVRTILAKRSRQPGEFEAEITAGSDKFGQYLSVPIR